MDRLLRCVLNRLDRKKSQWLVATRTDGYWASLVGFIFSFLFFLWPIIISKRRRNACGLGNKVAVSYYLVETQKKKLPRKHCQHIQVSLLPSSCALFCRLMFFGHFKGGSICIESYWRLYRSCCTLWLISYVYSSSNDSFDLLSFKLP